MRQTEEIMVENPEAEVWNEAEPQSRQNEEMRTGWIAEDGKWYYYDGSGIMQTGWQRIGGYWFYLKSSGEMATGWQQIGGYWFYLKSSGEMATGWQQIGGYWFYLKSSGEMATGWQQIGGYWFYLKSSGEMATGWQQIGGNWFYLKSSGEMKKGWLYWNAHWYYLKDFGDMTVGWKQIGGIWYYFQSSGEMATGWLKYGDKWYYLKSGGEMATGWQRVGEIWYYFETGGAWVPDKKKNDFIGVDRAVIVAELTAHQYDSYYLGTRYRPMNFVNGNRDLCMHPNGSPGANGYVGLNCTGFVAFVYKKCGGNMSELDRLGKPGGYVNAISWLAYAQSTGRAYYGYNSVSALLASGRAEKGDLIYCEPDWSKPGADCHIGFFWGNTPGSNVFWHQVGTNIISNIKAGTPQQRYYIIKTG